MCIWKCCTIFLVVLIIIGILYGYNHLKEKKSINVSSICDCISATIACFSFILALISVGYAYSEYTKNQEFEQCDVLMRYNERYENSKSIQSVVSYYADIKGDSDITKPSVNEREMFLRFFEELNLMIDKGYLTKDVVADTFAFYFIVAWEDATLFGDILCKDNQGRVSDTWHNAYSFYKKMKDTEIAVEARTFLKQIYLE